MDNLITKAKSGDEAALEQFFSEHKVLVNKVCRSVFLLGGEKDDILQEGMIGLYKALQAYDQTKTASFNTFATTCIKNQVLNAVKTYGNQKNRPLNNGLSIDTEGGVVVINSFEEGTNEENPFFYVIQSPEPNPQEKMLSKERLAEMIAYINKSLSPLEKQVLSHYLLGTSQTEIATSLQLKTKSVDNAITRIKTKLLHLKSI